MLRREAESSGERCFSKKQIKDMVDKLGIKTDSEMLIDCLNDEGELLKRGSLYRV